MAVQSNTFGGLRLSGDDAAKFRSQTRARTKSAAADKAVSRGTEAAKALLRDGFVTVAK